VHGGAVHRKYQSIHRYKRDGDNHPNICMSDKFPDISGRKMVNLLEKLGVVTVRIKSSHHRMKHQDGRVTTIPVHKNDSLPKGLLRKIIREDIEISVEEFNNLVRK
jgi:predicted RNA binding protein YcfA (HicA-like mRNA interferase family)